MRAVLQTRIVNFASLLVGRIRGGLAMVNSVAALFFGNISGSAVADVSSVGSVMIPMMKKNGYEADYAVGVTIASAIQGVVVPPSHNLVLYSLSSRRSFHRQFFMAGIVPGVIMLIALMITAILSQENVAMEKRTLYQNQKLAVFFFMAFYP